jgi:hypothetical protein
LVSWLCSTNTFSSISAKRSPAAATEQQRRRAMHGLDRAGHTLRAVVRPVEVHGPTVQRGLDDPDSLAEPFDPHPTRPERDAGPPVLGAVPAGAQPELEQAVAQQVERRGLLGEDRGVAEVVGEHVAADPQAGGRVGGRDHGGHRRHGQREVVGDQEIEKPESSTRFAESVQAFLDSTLVMIRPNRNGRMPELPSKLVRGQQVGRRETGSDVDEGGPGPPTPRRRS